MGEDTKQKVGLAPQTEKDRARLIVDDMCRRVKAKPSELEEFMSVLKRLGLNQAVANLANNIQEAKKKLQQQRQSHGFSSQNQPREPKRQRSESIANTDFSRKRPLQDLHEPHGHSKRSRIDKSSSTFRALTTEMKHFKDVPNLKFPKKPRASNSSCSDSDGASPDGFIRSQHQQVAHPSALPMPHPHGTRSSSSSSDSDPIFRDGLYPSQPGSISEASKALLVSTMNDWEEKFGFLQRDTIKYMKQHQVTVEELSEKLIFGLPQRLKGLRKCIEENCCTTDVYTFITSFDYVWSFIDYELLRFIINRLKDDKLEEKMKVYEDEINIFFDTTTIEQLIIGMNKPRVDKVEVVRLTPIVVRFNWNPKRTLVREIKLIQEEIPKMFPQELLVTALTLYNVYRSSVTITWKFWTNSVDGVINSAAQFILRTPEFITKHQIISFNLNGRTLFPESKFTSRCLGDNAPTMLIPASTSRKRQLQSSSEPEIRKYFHIDSSLSSSSHDTEKECYHGKMARTPEKDTLRIENKKINSELADLTDLNQLGSYIISNNFLSRPAVSSILDLNDSNLTKVSKLMMAVNTSISASRNQEMSTSRFNKFLLMLYNDLGLTDLAMQLAHTNRKISAEHHLDYTSPLLTSYPSTRPTGTECTKEIVTNVVRKVSSQNLCSLQNLLIHDQHPHVKLIMDFINTRADYAYYKHDYIVYFWFATGNPSWKHLIASLKSSNEGTLAEKIEDGELLEFSSVKPDVEISYSQQVISGTKYISKHFSYLTEKFCEFVRSICQLLERKVDFHGFVFHANNYFTHSIGRHTTEFDKYFTMAQELGELSMWHYSPLEKTLESIFGYDKDYLLLFSKYEGVLTEFLQPTYITEVLANKELRELLFGKNTPEMQKKSPYGELSLKIEKPIKELQPLLVKDLWKSLRNQFHLNPTTAIPQHFSKGSTQIVWKVPEEVCQSILELGRSAVKYFTASKQIALWINGECIYHKDIRASNDLAFFCLCRACEMGREHEVKSILEVEDIKINSIDSITGKTPLMLAAAQGYTSIIEMLLNKDALPNNKEETLGRSALFYTVEGGHKCAAEMLIENRANVLMTDKNGLTVMDIAKKSSQIYSYLKEVSEAHHCLFQACEVGDLHTIERLMEDKKTLNINSIRSDGKTPLAVAAQFGHNRIADFLVRKEAYPLHEDNGKIAVDYVIDKLSNFESLSEETLIALASKGNVKRVNQLLDLGVNPNCRQKDEDKYTPLLWACENGHFEVVKILLDYGADPELQSYEGWNALLLACRYAHYDIVKMLLKKEVNVNAETEDGWTALLLIASYGKEEIAELLLKKKADPIIQDEDGFTPLCQAAQDGHYEMVKLLVEAYDQHVDEYKTIKPENWTPIMLASKNGHLKIVEYLVAKGADIDRQKQEGITPLHIASYNGKVDVVRYLCQTDASVDIQDKDGITSLMYAAKQGHLEVAEVLLKKSADIKKQDKHLRWTAPHFALQGGHMELFHFFLDYEYKDDTYIDLDHKDSCGNNIIELSLRIDREAYRSIERKYPNKFEENGGVQSIADVKSSLDRFNKYISSFNKIDVPDKDNFKPQNTLIAACA